MLNFEYKLEPMIFIQQMLHTLCTRSNRSNAHEFLGHCSNNIQITFYCIQYVITSMKIIARDWHSSTVIPYIHYFTSHHITSHQIRDLFAAVCLTAHNIWFHLCKCFDAISYKCCFGVCVGGSGVLTVEF